MSFEVSLLYNQDTVGGPICLSEFPFPLCLTAMWFIFFIFLVDMWFIFNLMYLLRVLFLVLMPYHLGLFVVCEEVFLCIKAKGVYNSAMPSKEFISFYLW
jgi:hypothetical protein